jgi:hypothetical protein
MKGGLAVDARVFSSDRRIVADIEKNTFTVNPNNYFKIKRPDKSTFVVYNQQDEVSLSVDFVAPNYMVVNRTFYHPNIRSPLVATSDAVKIGGLTIGGAFSYNDRVLFQFGAQ